MKTRTNQSPEDYQVPLTPDGTIEFAPDPTTGEEQIDLHTSQLDRIARDAYDLAEPSHAADPESIDTRRVEFGSNIGKVIDTTARLETLQPISYVEATHPAALRAYGKAIADDLRQAKLDEENNSKAA